MIPSHSLSNRKPGRVSVASTQLTTERLHKNSYLTLEIAQIFNQARHPLRTLGS